MQQQVVRNAFVFLLKTQKHNKQNKNKVVLPFTNSKCRMSMLMMMMMLLHSFLIFHCFPSLFLCLYLQLSSLVDLVIHFFVKTFQRKMSLNCLKAVYVSQLQAAANAKSSSSKCCLQFSWMKLLKSEAKGKTLKFFISIENATIVSLVLIKNSA